MRVAFALSHGDDVEVPPPAPKNYKKAPARQAVNPSMCPESHKVVVLLADGDATPQIVQREISQINAAQADGPPVGIPEAQQQAHAGRLARP